MDSLQVYSLLMCVALLLIPAVVIVGCGITGSRPSVSPRQ
jgi:hypothetical protein